MKLKKYCILIISFLAILSLPAQEVEDVIRFSDDQFSTGNYSIAAQEYNRALFFGSDRIDYLSLKIGHCYIEMADYELAANFYDRSYRYSQNDSIKNESVLGKVFCLLMQKENIPALSELLYLGNELTPAQEAQSFFLTGIAHYGMGNDTLAYDSFRKALEFSGSCDSVNLALTEEFNDVFRYKKRYNPLRSYIISGVIPGSGQIAVGEIKEGINSLLLLAALWYFTFEVALTFSLLDAIITFLPWFQRYYFGGMEKAKGLAESKIESKRYESYLRILELTTPACYR